MKTTRRGLFGLVAGMAGAAVLGKGVGPQPWGVVHEKMTTAPRYLVYTNGKVYSTNLRGTDWQEHPSITTQMTTLPYVKARAL